MQDTICCYVKLVYLQLEWIVEIPTWLSVDRFIQLLNQHFSGELVGQYLFEKQNSRILDASKTFLENEVETGEYLYLI